jgi:hypothetical protein
MYSFRRRWARHLPRVRSMWRLSNGCNERAAKPRWRLPVAPHPPRCASGAPATRLGLHWSSVRGGIAPGSSSEARSRTTFAQGPAPQLLWRRATAQLLPDADPVRSGRTVVRIGGDSGRSHVRELRHAVHFDVVLVVAEVHAAAIVCRRWRSADEGYSDSGRSDCARGDRSTRH